MTGEEKEAVSSKVSAKARTTGSRISGPVIVAESAGVWKKVWEPAMPKKRG